MKAINGIFSLGLLLVSLVSYAANTDPETLVRTTTNDVLEIVKQDKDIQAGSEKKVLDLVEAKVLPHFDFTRMTILAVGKHWNSASPAQQKALSNEFKTMLVRTYSSSIAAYKNQKIEIKPVKPQANDTEITVKTEVNQPGGQPIPIDYSMEKTAQGWKVYDVIVDGVSLVTNYRSSFSSTIRQAGIDGLIKSLSDRNKSLATGGANKS